MFICVRKFHLRLAAVCLCCAALGSAFLLCAREEAQPVFSIREGAPVTVIVDPGHGGVDGGAVSPDGTAESQLNLDIALRVEDLLRFTGQRTGMTRREDVSIHSPEADTIRAKKVSDLKNRVNLVNSTENAVLLSIHQNSLPSSPSTWGAQAFYNTQEGGEALAEAVQVTMNQCINTQRAKEAKAIGSGVYLMKHIEAPGVLVECGFLSNQEEAARLRTAEHQRKIACAIVSGFLRGMAGEDVP